MCRREQLVQIIEVTDVAGVRAAVHTFGRRSTPLQFVVFPMVHLAEAAFYEQVQAKLKDCDLVVAEGVTNGSGRAERRAGRDDRGGLRVGSGRPPRGRMWSSVRLRALTGTYRWVELDRRFGLTVQDIDAHRLGVPVVNPDVSAAELGRLWRQYVPLVMSAAVWILIPVYTIGIWLFGTRRLIGRNLAMDDLPAAEEVLVGDRVQAMIDVVVKRRDSSLLKALASIHEERCEEPIRVAVVYGARHVPAVITGLHVLGYRHRSAEWLPVFGFDS
jgi:hypothetical protein